MSLPDKANSRVKSPHQQRVEAFMRLAGQEVPEAPTDPDDRTRILRAKLIFEEAMETINGLGVQLLVRGVNSGPEIAEGCEFHLAINFPDAEVNRILETREVALVPCDLAEVADGCADLRVVTTGTLSACGIADEALQEAVDINNLEKFGPGHTVREDGKLVKPLDHRPPDIEAVLLAQGKED